MSTHSDHGVGYLWSLMVGFGVFALFGVCTFFIFLLGDLKKPTDRVMEGDFSADQTALRIKNLEEIRLEQAGAVKVPELEAALKNFKAPPAAPTEVVVPGSPTSLKAAAAAQPPAPAPENPPAESKDSPKEPGDGKDKAGKGDESVEVKEKGTAPAKAKADAPAKAKGNAPAKAKGNAPAEAKGNAPAKGQAKGN